MSPVSVVLAEDAVLLVGAFVLYAVLLRRLAVFVHPSRLKMAKEGEEMLASGLPLAEDRQVKFYLDNAFSAWPMVSFAVMFPFFAAKFIIKSIFRKEPKRSSAADLRGLPGLFFISTFAANPLFGTIAILEIALCALFLVFVAHPSVLIRATLALLRAEAQPWTVRRASQPAA